MHRFLISSHKSPLFKFIFVLSFYSAYLYDVSFKGYGRIDMEKTIQENNKIFQAWLSYVFVLSRNVMYQMNGAQTLQVPDRTPVFNREKSSGMYSAHAFYFSTLLHQIMIMIPYVMIIGHLSWISMNFENQSEENYYAWMWTFVQINLVWTSYALMFGCFFTDFFSAFNVSILYVGAADVGSGKFVHIGGKQKSWRHIGIWLLKNLTPNRFINEKLMRRITSGTEDFERPALFFFGFTQGDDACDRALFRFFIVFLLIGWSAMMWRGYKL